MTTLEQKEVVEVVEFISKTTNFLVTVHFSGETCLVLKLEKKKKIYYKEIDNGVLDEIRKIQKVEAPLKVNHLFSLLQNYGSLNKDEILFEFNQNQTTSLEGENSYIWN